MSAKVWGISLDIIWENCSPGFLRKVILDESRRERFLRVWPWWKDFLLYSDLIPPIISQAH